MPPKTWRWCCINSGITRTCARSVYVVDVRQSLHFTQVFKILEIAGYEQARKCVHVAYELVTLPGNVVVSSREGTVVLLEDLLREAITRGKGRSPQEKPRLDRGTAREAWRKRSGWAL